MTGSGLWGLQGRALAPAAACSGDDNDKGKSSSSEDRWYPVEAVMEDKLRKNTSDSILSEVH